MANIVAIAVKLTDKAVLALDRYDIKLEILPPGHAATINIPKAILGKGSIAKTNKKVIAGNTKN